MEQLKIQKKWLIIAASVLVVLGIGYFCGVMYFTEHFFLRTNISGIDCSGRTAEEAEQSLQDHVEKYVLQVIDVNENVEEIKGSDFEIEHLMDDEVQKVHKKQNPYLWFVSLFKEQNIELTIDFKYNEELLNAAIANMECMKAENQVAPVSATLAYQNGTFEIVDEVYGTQIDVEKIYPVIRESVDALAASVNLGEKGCYVQPVYTTESEKVLATQAELNKYLTANITYSLDSTVVTVDKDKIAEWVYADADMNPVISAEKVKAFTDTLGASYNTPDEAQTLTTPTGKQVSISGAKKGRIVGSDSECTQLIEEIKAGTVTTRSPILSQEATPEGELGWGTTYVEVDITEQHMWYIQNGTVVFESDVVTGAPGRDTPTGIFEILTKKRDKVLKGNIMPNGQREYETPVSYWARVTWTGIGFHDATWQAQFGGQRYLQGYGSHGCINMPFSAVKEFYGMISVGDTVIIHK
ncbi:MAG: L,D-transpeptidase/peptidoglycan binding protein [Tyzzerella sp.]|nr:L,D-transpeptidase/peptidoglycan binding protein [Tyzzerella sp.]